ncbi:MAG: YdcF family protein [Proteobacteria bacterium]|nr:YdcF family protein [Pseudomonadota bacterium]
MTLLFVLGKIAGWLTTPTNLLLAFLILGTALVWRRPRRSGRALLVLGIAGLIAIWTLPVGQWALLPLEDRFPQVTHPPAHVDGIIVLGGGVSPDMSAVRGIPALNGAAERVTTAAVLARRYPEAKVLYTSGSGELAPGAPDEATPAGALLAALGVAPDRLILESRSRTTYENVRESKALADPKPGQTWILVTSAAHMPRSVGLFRKAGWDVLPWPVGYKSATDARLWLPEDPGLMIQHLDVAMHEWVGLVGYWLEGRIDSVFPGP